MSVQTFLLMLGCFFAGIFVISIYSCIQRRSILRSIKNNSFVLNDIKEKWMCQTIHNFSCKDCQKEVLWLIKEVERYRKIMEKIYSNNITLTYKKDKY